MEKSTNRQGPEIAESPSMLWPRARGVLGAFLGALGAAFLLTHLLFSGSEKTGGAAILLGALIGFGASFGYWLFRGARERHFSTITIYVCTGIAPFPAFFTYITLYTFRLLDWPAAGSPAFFQALRAAVKSLTVPQALVLMGLLALLGLLFAGTGAALLLRYTDAAFSKSPLRLANQRAGGLLYNFWPEGGPDWQTLPPSFRVDAPGAPLQVTGETVRVAPALRKERTFSVWDAAGMIVGPSNGSCVVYDFQENVLAKFGMANRNASLLVQYLQEYGVPFFDPDGSPLEAPNTKTPASPNDVSFVVPMRSTTLAMATLGLCLAGSIVLALMVMALSASRGLPLTQVIIFFPLFGVALPALPLCAAGQLLPGLLAVEKGRLYRQSIWRKKRWELPELGYLRVSSLDKNYVLYSKDEIILATFSGEAPHADQLLTYLAERHHITPPAKD